MFRSRQGNASGKVLLASGIGVMLGLMANPARKLAVQGPTMLMKAAWDKALAAEHKATLAIIDLIERSDPQDTARRAIHLAQLKHALAKHSFQEENTVYAMMRQRGLLEPAKALNEDHGVVKLMLFELTEMAKDDPRWIEKVAELRRALEEHMAEEEGCTSPAFAPP